MPVPADSISRLVTMYRRAIETIIEDFLAALKLEGGSFSAASDFVAMRNVLSALTLLDQATEDWALREFPKIYRATQMQTAAAISDLGVDPKDVQRLNAFRVLNREAVEALINSPEDGFVSVLKRATQGTRDRIRQIHTQARLLRAQQGLINQTIARVGLARGKSISEVRDALVGELLKLKDTADLVWRPEIKRRSTNNLLRAAADLPYVRFSTVRGERHIRLDDYARLVARTKLRQAEAVARRTQLIESELPLVRISLNKPLTDDACWLYIGKVFALTAEAAKENGVPMVDELPAGGVPFHPNCTHTEVPFATDVATAQETRLGFRRPPSWALNRPWGEVEREFRKRGGVSAIGDMNEAGAKFGRETGGRRRRREEAARG